MENGDEGLVLPPPVNDVESAVANEGQHARRLLSGLAGAPGAKQLRVAGRLVRGGNADDFAPAAGAVLGGAVHRWMGDAGLNPTRGEDLAGVSEMCCHVSGPF